MKTVQDMFNTPPDQVDGLSTIFEATKPGDSEPTKFCWHDRRMTHKLETIYPGCLEWPVTREFYPNSEA